MDKSSEQKDILMVTVQCLVYNHEPYLRKCLDGFVMQQTDFRFEVIVHEDVSTDGSVAIVREYAQRYPEIIKPIFETENQYSKKDGSLGKIMDAVTTGRYIAFCEGDDCWTDPLKLQKEFDFLETHPDYGMVHTHAEVWDEKTDSLLPELYGADGMTFEALLVNSSVTALTVMCRRDLYMEARASFDPQVSKTWLMGDYPLWLWIAAHSKVGFIPEVTGRYNSRVESASHSSSVSKVVDFCFNAFEISYYFATLYLKDKKAWQSYIDTRFRKLYHMVKHTHCVEYWGRFVRYFKKDYSWLCLKNKFRYWIHYAKAVVYARKYDGMKSTK